MWQFSLIHIQYDDCKEQELINTTIIIQEHTQYISSYFLYFQCVDYIFTVLNSEDTKMNGEDTKLNGKDIKLNSNDSI